MNCRRFLSVLTSTVSVVLGLTAAVPVTASAADEETYIVVSDNNQAREADINSSGHRVVGGREDAGVLIVRSRNPVGLAGVRGVSNVAKDQPRLRVPEPDSVSAPGAATPAPTGPGCATISSACPLQWDLDRIHVPGAWGITQGTPQVRVAVLDTGLTSTHEEVIGSNYDVAHSRSFVQSNSFCSADAATFASLEDYHGHGTWTATHVAGRNGPRMTGIAPRATLINVRVLGTCGFGLDSWVLSGMLYAGQVGARVESMSLGGYICADGVVPGSFYCGTAAAVGNDPVVWKAYQKVVRSLAEHGTLVVAAAGNEHVQLDARGRVISVGSLAFVQPPGNSPANDLRGLSEAPGGVPGVVAVAAHNRRTVAGSAGDTKFGQFGLGRTDQLSYFSSYGQRIDVSAPGGARNYNVPVFDCLSDNCKRLDPSTATETDNPGDFGAWGVEAANVPCKGACYINVQGTSMATPQVAGVAALTLSVNRGLQPEELTSLLRGSVSAFRDPNATPAIESDPAKPTYNYDIAYSGSGVPNSVMGRGVIDALIAVRRSARD